MEFQMWADYCKCDSQLSSFRLGFCDLRSVNYAGVARAKWIFATLFSFDVQPSQSSGIFQWHYHRIPAEFRPKSGVIFRQKTLPKVSKFFIENNTDSKPSPPLLKPSIKPICNWKCVALPKMLKKSLAVVQL